MRTLFLARGHSQKERGARNHSLNIGEWDLTNKICNQLKGVEGIVIVPSFGKKSSDEELAFKTNWVNDRMDYDDVFIDLHLNTSRGALILRNARQGIKESADICYKYAKATGIRFQGSVPDYFSRHSSLWVCQQTDNLRGYVLELGSIKHIGEVDMVQDQAVRGILAIRDYLQPFNPKDALRKKLGLLRKALANASDKTKKTISQAYEKVKKKLSELLK